jgi:dTDP-4-amino-4,6-dideoxygalactose transaminase
MQPISDPRAQNQKIKPEILAAIQEVVDSGWYILGAKVRQFEQALAKYCQTKYCVGTGNGTDAITLTLLALGIGSGDEVVCPSLTAAFTALAISATGAKPVFVDIDESTFTLDPQDTEKKITKKTKAIIPVHLYGHPADMDEIKKIAKAHKLWVIEDACQAHGAEYKGKKVGSLGDAGCFSFYPTKNLGAIGDGGAVVTDNQKLAEKIKILRHGGQKNRYEHVLIGRNSRLDELQAAILLVKLKHLEQWNEKRRHLASLYRKKLVDLNLILPTEASWAKSVWHLYVIRTKKQTALIRHLEKNNIQTQIHYPIPVHCQVIYNNQASSLPTTERLAREIISLPLYPELSQSGLVSITKIIKAWMRHAS